MGLSVLCCPSVKTLPFPLCRPVSTVIAWVYERSGRSWPATVLLLGSMTTALPFIPVSFATVETALLLFPAVLVGKMKLRTKKQ